MKFIHDWVRRIATVVIAIFIVTVGIVCLKGLVLSINAFMENQQAFSKAYSDAAAAIAMLPPEEQKAAQVAINHLEQLQTIQKNATTSDLMSFLYSTLSTILVGLCAGFVAKSHKHADEAKEDARKSNDSAKGSSQSAEKAGTDALQAAQLAEQTKASSLQASNHAEQAKHSALQVSESVAGANATAQLISQHIDNAKETVRRAEATYSDALLQMQKQKDTTSVLRIHIEIVHARAALFSRDQTDANQRVYNVSRSVLALTTNIDIGAVLYLQQELLSLETAVDYYREHAETISDVGKKTSMSQAVIRYMNELDKAVKHCDTLIRQSRDLPTVQSQAELNEQTDI